MQPKHFQILVQTPRLLVARLKAPGLRETMAVARAPRSHASDDACATHWGQLSAYTMRLRIDLMMVCLACPITKPSVLLDGRSSEGGSIC